MNKTERFNERWEFSKSSLEADTHQGLSFEPVAIPHDWLIQNTTDLYENSIGWYRKNWNWQKNDQRVFIVFDGVYMDSSLYVNGQPVGEWKYGYSTFEWEITDALQDGSNELLLKVIHQSPNSRWYSGAGIYRNVWLKTRGKNYLQTDGIYLSTNKQSDSRWKVEVETELEITEKVQLIHTLLKDSQPIASITGEYTVSQTVQQELEVEYPLLWSPEEPYLYEWKTELRATNPANELYETYTQKLGFRHVAFNPSEGLFLNGQKTKMNGVCEHHDLGALGAAFNPVALKRRFQLLKEMGVNGIRTAHNMPARELMDLADEMGFFIVSEAFDMWERPKTTYDYARFFPKWAYADVKSWVRRDRNHPSLILWSIGNEIYDTHADERGQEITRMLKSYVEEFDPKHNGRVTIGSNYMPWENAQKCADIVKVAGYNYAEKYYQEQHEAHPDWVIYGSETASVVQSRGIYHFPAAQPILSDDDLQCSALGNSSTSWGARSAEACIIAERDTPFSLGQFIWTGFDYIGEPTPYHTKNSYFGQLDTATFPKDSFYIYQANWTDYQTAPMVHLFPYWDFNPGQLIDVRIATNAPKVELYLNDQLLETRYINHQKDLDLIPTIQVPYTPGDLKAVAYDEKGQVIAEDSRRSFGDAARLLLKADKKQLTADGQDLIFVEIAAEDEDGNPVENANNRVNVEVTGAGRLVGLDNGDSTDYDQYKGISRRLFSGKLMAIIAATHQSGEIKMTVSSKGLLSASLELAAVQPFSSSGIQTGAVLPSNQPCRIKTGTEGELPLRKIEITSKDGQTITESKNHFEVTARLYPEDTSYQEVEWRVVNDVGIDSNIAAIETDGKTARVTALGDGNFRVRCTSRNGTKHVQLISELEMTAVGLGPAYQDPYSFISGGLYDDYKGEVTSGNERGVATSRDGETIVGYTGIDFGKEGSNTIHLPLFTLSDAVYTLQIWEGFPHEEESTLLADTVYQKESIWNVYQSETYHLSKRLTGLTSLYFVFQDKVHLKGFSFEKSPRSFAENRALDADQIYGDTFRKTEDAVEGIGNNVTLLFEEMDFGEEGTERLVLHGRSPIDKNTIHVRFQDAEGQTNQLIDFTYSKEYESCTFDLKKVTGKKDVAFIFLPGSQFDFGWFRFE